MPRATCAFGVEPGFRPYRLRLSRYQALAEAVAEYAAARPMDRWAPLQLLDVGVGRGRSRRYLEVYPHLADICYHGVDQFPHGHELVYKHEDWRLIDADLEHGLPFLDAEQFDVVLCEQVLEHLANPVLALVDLVRVLKPGGLLVTGVPTFPRGLHLVRKHVVPWFDRLLASGTARGHQQAFSARSFLDLLRGSTSLEVRKVRGFRIASGGPLAPLENYRWWWRLNRRIGAVVPSLCVEIQVLATKPAGAVPHDPTSGGHKRGPATGRECFRELERVGA